MRDIAEELSYAGYELIEEIGHGGMGTVYKARHRALSREVAVKVLSAQLSRDPVAMARFDNEMVTMASLDFPSIARVYDGAITGSGVPYFVMDLIEGPSLADELSLIDEPFEPAQVAEMLRPIAQAVDHLHEAGIVHRDIKPENILLSPSGAVLTDFGISYLSDIAQESRLTMEGIVVGTGMYMAPELYEAGVTSPTPATDDYALALIAYEMVTGSSFYSTVSREAWRGPRPLAHLKEVPVGHVFEQALANDPSKRFPNSRSFINALECSQAVKRQPKWWVAAVAAVMAVVVAAELIGRDAATGWNPTEEAMVKMYSLMLPEDVNGTGWRDSTCTRGTLEEGQEAKIVCYGTKFTFAIADYGSRENLEKSLHVPEEDDLVHNFCYSFYEDADPVAEPTYVAIQEKPLDSYAILVTGLLSSDLILSLPFC
nr:serine/threonine-protein kinase [Corynebacterium aquatimens]